MTDKNPLYSSPLVDTGFWDETEAYKNGYRETLRELRGKRYGFNNTWTKKPTPPRAKSFSKTFFDLDDL